MTNDADSCMPSFGPTSHDTSVSQITSITRIESPSPPTSNDNHFTEITSTPRIEQPSVSYHEHQLFLDSTSGGTELWTRNVSIQSKPQLGETFEKLEDAISFYNVYAEACGFGPRKSSQKKNADVAIFYKLVVCNREGFRDGKKRKVVVHDSVVEQTLIKPFDIKNNKLTRIGYSKEHADGYKNVGAQLIDFKNFGRDIKCFIGDKDAQLFINHFEDLRETNPGFYFAYEVDSFKFDHHKRSVTFAAALLFHKDEDSFKWVFEKFLDAMGQREPQCIIANQCPGIKKVVPKVFKKAKHRYCMWHIMQKVTDKIGSTISKETDFRHGSTAPYSKQHDRDNDYTLPQLATSLHLEAHASKVYTHAIFKDIQQEAAASMCSLSVGGFIPPIHSIEVIVVAGARMHKTFQVVFNSTSNDAECSCKLFNRKGIICKHIIWIFSGKQVKTLPDKYILMRWTKNAQKIPLYGSHGELLDDFDATDVKKPEMCKLWSEFYSTISVLRTMPNNQITDLADTLKQYRVKLNPQAQLMTKEQELEMLLGCSSSTEVRILPPRQAKKKGSGKRMISTKQQCIAKAEKPKRLCNNCKQLANHDKRNCPNPFVLRSSDDD
ncbi:protein FAR1-RELATED SEQUENCE 12-like [Silene latifolia]|uniref:protein FAR1-RELATED SEQUENCE 12-like n=1 Tax=Silene latifolia TaxID=37657 RepID=UPI003D787EDC